MCLMRHILLIVQFIMSAAFQRGFYLNYLSDFSRAKISSIVNYSGLRNLLFLISPQKPVISAM